MSLKYSFATLKNLNELLTLNEAFDLFREIIDIKKYDINRKKSNANNKKYLIEDLKKRSIKYIICKKGDDAIAYISFGYSTIYKSEGGIHELYVLPKERKQGIANQLIEMAMNWLKQKNCTNIDLYVDINNKLAYKIYKKLGFAKEKQEGFSMYKKI